MNALMERLIDCSGGWGEIVTDFAEDYTEQGYHLSPGKKGIVFGNWNPKRFPTLHNGEPPLTREESLAPRLAAALEWAGYEIDWLDEWANCGECGRAMRTQADSYSWTMFGAFVEKACEYVCADCMNADLDSYIDQFANNPRMAVTWTEGAVLEEAGWVQWEPHNPHNYENGWYPGQTDDPVKITEEIRRDSEHDVDIVFMIDGVGQFDVRFSAYTRKI